MLSGILSVLWVGKELCEMIYTDVGALLVAFLVACIPQHSFT